VGCFHDRIWLHMTLAKGQSIDKDIFPKVYYIGHIGPSEACLSSIDYSPLGFFLALVPKQTLHLCSLHALSI